MKKLFVLSALAVVLSCQQKPNLEADLASLRKAAEDYNANAVSLMFDQVKSSYAPDAVIMAPGLQTVNADGISKFVDGFHQLKNFKATFSTPEVSLDASGDTGYSSSQGTLSYDIDEERSDREEIRDFHVWKKQQDGTWKLSVDIWNEMGEGIEGVYEYLPPLKGQSVFRNGTFMILAGPSDGKGSVNSHAGTYALKGDTVKCYNRYANDARMPGTSFAWRVSSISGDTLSFQILSDKGQVVGNGRTVRISN